MLWSLSISRMMWLLGIWLILLLLLMPGIGEVEARIDFSPLLNPNHVHHHHHRYSTEKPDSSLMNIQDEGIHNERNVSREEFNFNDRDEKKQQSAPIKMLARLQGTHQLLNRVLFARDLLAIPSLLKELREFHEENKTILHKDDEDERWFVKEEHVSKQLQLKRRSDMLLRNPSWNRRVISIRFPPVSLVLVLQPATSAFHHHKAFHFERTFGSTSSLRKLQLPKEPSTKTDSEGEEDPTVLCWERGLCVGLGHGLRVSQQLQSLRRSATVSQPVSQPVSHTVSPVSSASVWTLAAQIADEIHRDTLTLLQDTSDRAKDAPVSELLSQFFFLDLDTFHNETAVNHNNFNNDTSNFNHIFNLWLQGRGVSVQVPGQVCRHDTDVALGPDAPLLNEWFQLRGKAFRRMLYEDVKRQRLVNETHLTVKDTFAAAVEHAVSCVASTLPMLFNNNSETAGEGWEVVFYALLPVTGNETAESKVQLRKAVLSGEEFVQLLDLTGERDTNVTQAGVASHNDTVRDTNSSVLRWKSLKLSDKVFSEWHPLTEEHGQTVKKPFHRRWRRY